MPLTPKTSTAIRDYLLAELTRYINENSAAGNTLVIKPFHARLLPLLFNVSLSERSFSTRSGGWFQQMAKLVAQQYHPVVQQPFTISGHIQPAASSHIETILGQMDKGKPKRKPSRIDDTKGVLTVQSAGGAELSVTADLFIKTASGNEWYFEMKTAQPNKGQCKEMKRFILQVAALRKDQSGQAYASTAYNAEGDGMPTKDGKIKQFLEPGADILIGRQFWEKIGDNSTYEELLVISEEVGHKITLLIEQSASTA
jgi:type II restriction enzyme